jgi:hypothetical protein
VIYTQPSRYVCEECGGIASYPNPHSPRCPYRGAGQFAMSPMVSTIRQEQIIAQGMIQRGLQADEWPEMARALLGNLGALLTGIDQTTMGRVPA